MERDLNDQAYNLRRSMWRRGHNATYVSISSGKGGVGKTTFAINFACLLAKDGKKVLLFDADLGLANVDIMLKVNPKATINEYLNGKVSLSDVLVKNIYGFDLFPASSGIIQMAELTQGEFDKIQQIFVYLDEQYDFIIFDTGAGIANNVHRFAAMADNVVVISQPEPAAIADGYAFLKTAQQLYDLKKAYLVFNRVDDTKLAQKVFQNLQGVVRKFLNIELVALGHLSEDPEARRSQRTQKPLCETAPDSKFVRGLVSVVRQAEMW